MRRFFEGKTALVTGASRGIGFSIAKALAANGCRLGLVSTKKEEIEKIASQLSEEFGVSVLPLQTDVRQSIQVQEAVDQMLETFGNIDYLINNAGITRDNILLKMKEEDWDEVVHTNLKGPFLFSKAVCKPMMKQKSGSILNISSVVGLMGNPGQANYAATKAGIIGMTKSGAPDSFGRGVRCNAICPGTVDSPSRRQRIATQARASGRSEAEVERMFIDRQPMGRLGRPEEIAALAVYLASDEAAFTTGQAHVIDGGWLN